MSTPRRRLFLSTSLCSLLILAACGGGSSMHVAPQAPVFTSTPPSAAAQDTAYRYSIAATDPAGGTVSFALTTGPTGAAVSGNGLTWTPAASQSRLSNGFTVTATTSEGGTATQSWSVSPSGTVTVNEVITYWTPTGLQQVPRPASSSINISAVVPQSDGSVTVFQGASTAPGVISILGVPAGYYWLTFGPPNTRLQAVAFWTSTSSFDAGRDIAGTPVQTTSSTTSTILDFNLSGLDAVALPTPVAFKPDMQLLLPFFGDPANSTNLSLAFNIGGDIDWSQVKTAFLLQYEPSTFGPWSNLVLGPAATLADLSLANGTTNTITQALQASPLKSFDVSVPGSQWAPLLQNASASAPTSFASGMSLAAEPYVTGINASFGLSDLTLVGTALQLSVNGFSFQPFGVCDPMGFSLLGQDLQPAILADQDLGSLQYADPFPSAWTRVFNFCQEAMVPIALPNSSSVANFALVAGERIAPPSAPIGPLVGPVQAPAIGGGSLFTPATLGTSAPTLSWSAPSGVTPTGYRVQIYVASTLSTGGGVYLPAGSFSTAKTSVTLLPLSGGNTYVFAITALVDSAANFETRPYRSALPTAFASVVSAPITISAGDQTRIHGDAGAVKQLSEPRIDSRQR
jgi:hypothetical protein